MQDIFDPSYTNLVSNNSVEILPPTEANKKIKYVNANKKGNVVWNARSTQKVYSEENEITTLHTKVKSIEDSLNNLELILEKILEKVSIQ